jgi:hypothetical protein
MRSALLGRVPFRVRPNEGALPLDGPDVALPNEQSNGLADGAPGVRIELLLQLDERRNSGPLGVLARLDAFSQLLVDLPPKDVIGLQDHMEDASRAHPAANSWGSPCKTIDVQSTVRTLSTARTVDEDVRQPSVGGAANAAVGVPMERVPAAAFPNHYWSGEC